MSSPRASRPSGTTSSGKAINAFGQVAGQATPSGGSSYAVLYSGGRVNAFGKPYSTSTSEAIGAQGQVTGTYMDKGVSHAFFYNGKAFVELMPGYSSFVSGTRSLNAAGSVTGGFQIRNTLHGFVYSNGHASTADGYLISIETGVVPTAKGLPATALGAPVVPSIL
jgi:hypothetical protein